MNENELSTIIIGLCIKVHRKLGPGLLESVYEECLSYELHKSGLSIKRQIGIQVKYDSIQLNHGFRADIIVEEKVILEIKSVENLLDVHKAQLLTYLKLSEIKLGLLINFNSAILKDGIKRIVNNL
jgi:GxxExxY protein